MTALFKRMRRIKSEDGASAVEFALVLPILLLLVFGIIEFGFIFNRWITVTHAAREGVRVYALTDLAQGLDAAHAAAPDLFDGQSATCTGGPSAADPKQVEMTCEIDYNLSLYVIDTDITVSSTARMRDE